MGSAEFQLEAFDFPSEETASDARAELKQQVAERLAAHRSRRSRQTGPTLIAASEPKPAKVRANRIAAAVADRYAQSQSYRDFLAAEAERAIEAANAAAEVATRNAQAVTVAQQQLLAELSLWDEPEAESATPETSPEIQTHHPVEPVVQAVVPGLTVRLYEDVGVGRTATAPSVPSRTVAYLDEEEFFALDEEIAFRQTPVFEEPSGPPIPIPANLIEFPRQLIAPRKSRPRIAEGPLREEADTTHAAAQLRIFEVEASQIATTVSPEVETSSLPEWSSIHLDAAPIASQVEAPVANPDVVPFVPPQAAPLNLRMMAALVDACILGATFLAAICAFAPVVTELPSLPIAAIAALGTLVVLFVLYHLLFFTFAEATPGMRYARIGLCTLSDENPTRSAMRRRTWAVLLSAAPLGLGFLWAWLDEEGLGWHDRISRMYQRSY